MKSMRLPARRAPGLCLLLATVFTVSAVAAQTKNRTQAMELVRQAAVAFGKSDMKRVLDLCSRATRLDPAYPRSYNWIGAALQRQGDRNGACAAFARVIQLAPRGADADRAKRGQRELSCAAGPLVATSLQARWQAGGIQNSVAFSRSGSWLAGGGQDGAWRVWNISTNQLLHLRPGDGFAAESVEAGQRTSALGSGSGNLRVYDLQAGKQLLQIEGRSAIKDLALAPQERTLAVARTDGSLQIYDVESGTLLRSLDSGATSAFAVAYSPDGRLLAASAGNEIRVYEAGSWRMVRRYLGLRLPAVKLAWSTDGSLLAAAVGSIIRVWNVPTNKFVHDLKGHTLAVSRLAFAKGNLLASAGFDPQIRFWDAGRGTSRGTLAAGGGPGALSFSASGQQLAVADASSMVWVWGIRG